MKRTALLVACLACFGCGSEEGSETASEGPSGGTGAATEEATPADPIAAALESVKAGSGVLLDVRTQDEWDSGHFASAKHIPVDQISDAEKAKSATADLDKEKTLYVHCARGVRAKTAADALNKMGFKAVALETSYDAIRDGGFDEAK